LFGVPFGNCKGPCEGYQVGGGLQSQYKRDKEKFKGILKSSLTISMQDGCFSQENEV